MKSRTQKRGAYTRPDCTFIGAWFPKQFVVALDEFVVAEDTDRSKVLRRAVTEKIFNKKTAKTELP